ncbi:MAG: Bug family tripartite tricarboxylate transporter substrate binding protein [Pseudolabrys sp.]
MSRRRLFALAATLCALVALSAAPLRAQSVPPTIRIIFPFAPGGSGDALARLVADKMSKALGNTVIVENRSGGAGRIGVRDVARAAPDGATLLLTPIAPMSVYQHVYKTLEYDPIKDFAPVSQLGVFDFGIAVGPQLEVKTLKELVAWAKAHPDKGSFGMPAAGTLPHFLGVMFSRAAGVNFVPIAYRGSAAALADVIAGHIPMIVTTTADLVQMDKAGRVRILATSDKARSPFLPDVPTFRESGYDLVANGWYAVFAPAKTPFALIERYSKVMAAAVHAPDVSAKLKAFGLTPTGTSAAELGRIQKDDSAIWAPAVQASGFTAHD